MLFDLPTNTSAERDGYTSLRENRYAADIDLKDRSCTITLYGAPLRLTPPLMVHAALLSYFARLEKRSIFENLENYGVPSNFEQQASAFTFRLPNLRDSRVYDNDFRRYEWVQCPSSDIDINSHIGSVDVLILEHLLALT